MGSVFNAVLNMSITGSYIAAAIIILRFLMKKLPKRYSYALWGILGIRLLCPFSFSSFLSLFNIFKPKTTAGNTMTYISENITASKTPRVSVGITPVNEAINTAISHSFIPATNEAESVNPVQIIYSVCLWVWLVGAIIMMIAAVISYLLVCRKTQNSEHLRENIYICKNINTPFVCGIIKPRIFLPDSVPEADFEYILAHERTHIRRGDHILKLVAMAALCLHWFNPLVWLSFRLMTKDMELSCDERAIMKLGSDVKKKYAAALLNVSMKQNGFYPAYPDSFPAFGRNGAKTRIENVLNYKKPALWAIIVGILAVIAAAILLISNSGQNTTSADSFVQFVFPNSSVNGDYFLTYNADRVITYYDLTEGACSPACALAGCTHDDKTSGCTAHFKFGTVRHPFMYGGKLYYFHDNEGTTFYKSELNGSGRLELYSWEREQEENGTVLISPWVQNVCIDENTLYLLVYENISSIEYSENNTEAAKEYPVGCKIYKFDLQNDEMSLFYESEKAYWATYQLYGVYSGKLYCYSSGNTESYQFDSYDDRLAAIQDENSDYNKTAFKRFFTIDTNTKNVEPLDAQSVYIGKGGAYYYNEKGLFSADGTLIAEEIPNRLFACAEGLIYTLGGKNYLFENGNSREFGNFDEYTILSESENYFICFSPDTTYVYCVKKDYLSGAPKYIPLENDNA